MRIADLEDELDFDSMRENEGEAANYGIYYDDTSYDYMQHLREVGDDPGEAHFVNSVPVRLQGKVKGKGKGKVMRLEDALRETSLDDEDAASDSRQGIVMDDGLSRFSSSARPKTYQDMQDVPDEIAGFQPDMDPRLREVLEALEDEAYVDEGEEDIFTALTEGGQGAEVDLDEFEMMQADEDDGWESDVTEKAPCQPPHTDLQSAELKSAPSDSTDMSNAEAEAASAEDGEWLRDFAKFKRDNVKQPAGKVSADALAASQSDIQAPASTLYTLGGTPLRQKRRKGALTNPSSFSMTSSSLARTDGQRLLDDRFESIEAMYAVDEKGDFDDEDGGISLASGISKQSKMSTVSTRSFADGPVRCDLDRMMDGFLDGWDHGHPGGGKRKGAKGKRGKNGNEILGMKMLDEVREGLGPARLRAQKA